nr:MAG TPA: hypothetical protein [Caudoviricetes sp.]
MSQYNEAYFLNRDLINIYKEWGTQNLKLLKYDNSQSDDLYGEGKPCYKEYSCIGRYKPTPIEELQTGVGLGEEEAYYTVYLVKNVLKKQGIDSVTVLDKIKYNEVELDILSVIPSAIIGDYALHWKLQCKGRNPMSLEI